MDDFDLDSVDVKITDTNTEREVVHNVLNNLSKTIRYCDEWANHCYASDVVDANATSGTFLDSICATLNNCRRAVLDAARLHKVCYDSAIATSALSFFYSFFSM